MSDQIGAALKILRRLPPSKINQNVQLLSELNPDIEDELVQRIDQIQEIDHDINNGKAFIKCEQNRDGDNYRSPWTNKYQPDQGDLYPSAELRELELKATTLFEEYRKAYYGDGVSSTYIWGKECGGFAMTFLVKKNVQNEKDVEQGSWDSTNLIDVSIEKDKVTYKITSTAVIDLKVKSDEQLGQVKIAGSLTKQRDETHELPNKEQDLFHLQKIGQLVEAQESILRSSMDSLLIGKTKEIIFNTRIQDGNSQQALQAQLIKDFTLKTK